MFEIKTILKKDFVKAIKKNCNCLSTVEINENDGGVLATPK